MTSRTSPFEHARALHALIRDEAPQAEQLGRLTDKVATALFDANIFSAMLPLSAGGGGLDRAGFFELVEEIAKADGSAGWCVSACATANFVIHRGASAEARREVFGSGPVAATTSLLPRARSTPAAGGFRLTGRFNWGSGSTLSAWSLVAEELPDRDGQQWFRGYVVPKADIEFKADSWDVMGLRASASVDYEIRDTFVPAHRAFEFPMIQPAAAGAISSQFGIFLNQVGFSAFASGVAAHALSELIASAAKTTRMASQLAQAQDHVVQFGVGELDGRLRAARSHFLNLVAAQDRHLAAHNAPDPTISLNTLQAAQTLTRAARDMTVFAFDHCGAGAVYAAHPLQRCLRDIFTGLKHASFSPNMLTRVGKTRLGVESPVVRLK